VLSCTASGELLRKSRQAMHKGVDGGRYPGFRDPSTGRVWVDRAWVEVNAPGGLRLLARLEALEAHAGGAPDQPLPASADRVGELERLVAQLQADDVALREENAGLREENAGLREENVATKTDNLIVLAAAADLQKAMTLMEDAQKHDERARQARRRAASASRRASEKFQEAVTQSQLPRSPGDLPS